MQAVSFIAALSTAPLSPRWFAFAETYRDICGAQDTDKRKALVRWRELLFLERFSCIQGLKPQCFFSYNLRENNDVRGLIGTVRDCLGCLLNWEFNIHCHQQNSHCYYLSWLQSVHFLSLLRIFKIDINVTHQFTLNIRSLFLWLS